jgi:hypothetical protein
MPAIRSDIPVRILVTGSRGKSSVVRLLQAGLAGGGLACRGRITGVVPREIGPGGEREIERAAGAHVGEMRWWLRQLPRTVHAVVLENSAISPELQPLAGHWLGPGLTLLTGVVPDHQEAWGEGARAAQQALCLGVPEGGRVILPSTLEHDASLRERLERRCCRVEFAPPDGGDNADHRAVNRGLALAACRANDVDEAAARSAMDALPPDRHEFRVVGHGGAEWALAFAANDVQSTRALFRGLGWARRETRLVYNHRADRPLRLRSFRGWLGDEGWREVILVGDRPLRRVRGAAWHRVRRPAELLARYRAGDRVFGCGNVAGLPLALFEKESIS